MSQIFDWLNFAVSTTENKIGYMLSIICVLMIIDFITGSVSAVINTNIEFKSSIGINGILRKLCSILVLVACIPIAPLIPSDMGLTAIVVLYFGYIIMEFGSILENLSKMGIDTTILTRFFEHLKEGDNK